MTIEVNRRQTAGYRPSHWGGMLNSSIWLDGKPWFTLSDIPRMLQDPAIQFGLRVLRAPIYGATWNVRGNSEKLVRFVDNQLQRIWTRSLRGLLDFFAWGWSVGEVTYTLEGSQLVFDRIWWIHPLDADPLEYTQGARRGTLAGIRVRGVEKIGTLDIYSPYAFWFPGEAEFGFHYGKPRIAGGFDRWVEKNGRQGAIESRRLWYHKNAFRSGIIRHPLGEIDLGNGHVRDCASYAREIAEKFVNGGVLTLPNVKTPDNTEQQWQWQDPASFGDVAGIRDYPEQLDLEIWEGMGIPRELVRAGTSGSGYSGRAIPAQVYFTSCDEVIRLIMAHLDRQILRHLVRFNFGAQARYEILPDSLSLKVYKQDGPQEAASPASSGLDLQQLLQQVQDDHEDEAADDDEPSYESSSFDDSEKESPLAESAALAMNVLRPSVVKLSESSIPQEWRYAWLAALLDAYQQVAEAQGSAEEQEKDREFLEGLRQLLQDPQQWQELLAAAKTIDLSWTAAKTRTGSIKAIGEGEHAGRVLYGKAAEAALRKQEKSGTSAASGKRGERQEKITRAKDLIAKIDKGIEIRELQELNDLLEHLTVADLQGLKKQFQLKMPSRLRHEGMVRFLQGFVQQKIQQIRPPRQRPALQLPQLVPPSGTLMFKVPPPKAPLQNSSDAVQYLAEVQASVDAQAKQYEEKIQARMQQVAQQIFQDYPNNKKLKYTNDLNALEDQKAFFDHLQSELARLQQSMQGQKRHAAFLALRQVTNPQKSPKLNATPQFTPQANNSIPAQKLVEMNMKNAHSFLKQLFNSDLDLSHVPVQVNQDKVVNSKGQTVTFRPFYSSRNKRVEICSLTTADVIVHEYAHAIEDANPKVLQASLQFLRRRVGNEPLTQLNTINSNYEPHEYGAKDQFDKYFSLSDAYYVGKLYADKQTQQRTASEVLSMGLQALYKDPVGFCAKDPDYAAFVIDVLRGKYN